MIALWIVLILCVAAIAVDGYLIRKLHESHEEYSKVVKEHERNIVCLSGALVKTNKNVAGLNTDITTQAKVICDLIEQFSKVEELIDAAKEHEQAAAKSEKQFQDGFASIMGYDFSVAMGKKDNNG